MVIQYVRSLRGKKPEYRRWRPSPLFRSAADTGQITFPETSRGTEVKILHVIDRDANFFHRGTLKTNMTASFWPFAQNPSSQSNTVKASLQAVKRLTDPPPTPLFDFSAEVILLGGQIRWDDTRGISPTHLQTSSCCSVAAASTSQKIEFSQQKKSP